MLLDYWDKMGMINRDKIEETRDFLKKG
jgi:hypothetical protein